jgi:hypothetical protein
MEATDANGTFRTPAEVDEYVLVAAHREGYAEVTVEELAKSNTIELQPWGRLEGEYVIAGQAQADQTIQIGAGRGDVEVVLHYSGTAKTDAAGKFSSGPIPPVQLYVSPLFHHGESDFNLGWFSGSIKVVPGETTRLNLPRPGKPLVGRVVLPADSGLKLADLSLTASINLRPPRMGFGELEGEQEAYAAFMESAAGKTFHRANIPVGKDGKFRIEGLPETTYLLQISANRRGDEAAHLAAWSVTRVTLTEQTDASTVLDLGNVVLKVSPPK